MLSYYCKYQLKYGYMKNMEYELKQSCLRVVGIANLPHLISNMERRSPLSYEAVF